MERTILDAARAGLGDSGNFVAAAQALIERQSEFLIPARAAQGSLQATAIDRWTEAFNLLEIHILVSQTIMSEHDEATLTHAETEGRFGVLALHHLYWAGHVVASEVLALFRQGFSAGALARWRALHEITTRAEFISQSGFSLDDTAERYLNHENFRMRAELLLLRAWMKSGGYDQPITREHTRGFADLDAELVARHGSIFRGEYGWAHAQLLDRDPKYKTLYENAGRLRGPTFADLDRHLRDDYDDPRWWDLLYSEASAAVHGAPRATTTFETDGLILHRGPDLDALATSPAGTATTRRLNSLAWACLVPDYGEPDESDEVEALMQLLETATQISSLAVAAFDRAANDAAPSTD